MGLSWTGTGTEAGLSWAGNETEAGAEQGWNGLRSELGCDISAWGLNYGRD